MRCRCVRSRRRRPQKKQIEREHSHLLQTRHRRSTFYYGNHPLPFGVEQTANMLVNRNIEVGLLRTSVRLEPKFWEALSDIAARERLTVDRICTIIEANAGFLGRTAAIRVFIASYFAEIRSQADVASAAVIERPAAYPSVCVPGTRAVG
jgi:predicted DNA-binding ribbon-helix-helix protein